MTPAVSFQKVSRHFGAVRAVDAVDLEIAEGEFFELMAEDVRSSYRLGQDDVP